MAGGQGEPNFQSLLNFQIFLKIILKNIMSTQDKNKIDLSGIQKHGFKQAKSSRCKD
jgi:hypothetical protein